MKTGSATSEYTIAPQRVGGGARHERSGKELLAAPVKTSSFTEVQAAGEALAASIKLSRGVAQKLEQGQRFELDLLLNAVESNAAAIARYLSLVNALPAPSEGRDQEIGGMMLPMAIYSWARKPPQGNAVLVQQLYLRAHPSDGPGLKLDASEWLRTSLQYLSISEKGKKFPAHAAYVEASTTVAPAYRRIQAELAEIDQRLGKLEQANAAAQGRGKPPPYADQVATQKGNRAAVEEQIKPLFDKIDDVAHVPQALDALDVKASASPAMLQALLNVTLSLERAALLAVRGAAGKRIEPCDFRIVLPVGSGKIEAHEQSVSIDELKAVGSDPKKLGRLLQVLETHRAALRTLYPALEYGHELPVEGPVKMREFLRQPFSRFAAPGQAAVRTLLQSNAREVRLETAKMLAAPVALDAQADLWGFVLEQPENYEVLACVVDRLLKAPDELEAQELKDLLKASPAIAESVLGPVDQVRRLISKGDLGALATFLDEQILERAAHPERLRSLGLLATLQHVAGDERLSRLLRHQIPQLDKIKEIASGALKGNEHLQAVLPEVVHGVVRALSQSLRDYYMEDPAGELEEFVENYRYFLKHPDCLKGKSGNEGLRTALAIFGPPGVGKTFLVNCLKNELNIPLFTLSPSQKKEGQDRLDYTRETIQKVKDLRQPCILLIDEAETTVVDRMSPAATSEDRDRTNYLLQEVDELRRMYPQVLIIIASNYPDRVDDAMIRPGRVDLVVHMKPPGKNSRESIIMNTLQREQVPLRLSEDQISELVEITEGFIPVQITQTIEETHGIYVPRMREKDEDFEFTFDLLKQRFEREASRLRAHQARLKKKGSSFVEDAQPGDAALG